MNLSQIIEVLYRTMNHPFGSLLVWWTTMTIALAAMFVANRDPEYRAKLRSDIFVTICSHMCLALGAALLFWAPYLLLKIWLHHIPALHLYLGMVGFLLLLVIIRDLPSFVEWVGDLIRDFKSKSRDKHQQRRREILRRATSGDPHALALPIGLNMFWLIAWHFKRTLKKWLVLDDERCLLAIRRLAHTNNPRAIRLLVPLLKNTHWQTEWRWRAAHNAIIGMGNRAVPELLAVLRRIHDPNLRHEVVQIIASMRDERASDMLLQILVEKGARSTTRRVAASGLANLHDDRVIAPALELFHETLATSPLYVDDMREAGKQVECLVRLFGSHFNKQQLEALLAVNDVIGCYASANFSSEDGCASGSTTPTEYFMKAIKDLARQELDRRV